MKKNPSRNTHLKKSPSKLLESINNSIDIDQRMYKEDIEGSIAHATMLGKQKIISKKDQTKIVKGLKIILQKIISCYHCIYFTLILVVFVILLYF